MTKAKISPYMRKMIDHHSEVTPALREYLKRVSKRLDQIQRGRPFDFMGADAVVKIPWFGDLHLTDNQREWFKTQETRITGWTAGYHMCEPGCTHNAYFPVHGDMAHWPPLQREKATTLVCLGVALLPGLLIYLGSV